MKRLCIGSFLKIIKNFKKPTVTQKTLINELLSIIKSDLRFEDEGFQSELLKCRGNLSAYEEIFDFDKNLLINEIHNKIEIYFSDESQKKIITCFQLLIDEDDQIFDITNIGFEESGYTKQDIVNKQFFNFSELLANIFYYSATERNNRDYKAEIREIDDDFFLQGSRNSDSILLDKPATILTSKLPLTINKSLFKSVFKEVSTLEMSIANNNHLKIFTLDITNAKFDYRNLINFIVNNVSNYIFSRAFRNSYNIPERMFELGKKTLKEYNKHTAAFPTTNHFNELMLYSFLESVLNAPKIFSKMELQDKSGRYNSKTSGMHLLSLKKDALPFNQIVYGASDTKDDLFSAIDNAFMQVIDIKNSINEEFEFVVDTIMNHEFDIKTNEILEKIILPSKENHISNPNNAFGMFIGYSPNISYEPNNDIFKEKMQSKLLNDIKEIMPYIEAKISTLDLQEYSFYIYLVPFNHADTDSIEIMKQAMEV